MSGFDTPAHHEYLARIDETVAAGPHDARWERLGTTPPRWYVDGKFGIFIHWGVYSVPAFSNEWYPRQMYREGSEVFDHHRATWGLRAGRPSTPSHRGSGAANRTVPMWACTEAAVQRRQGSRVVYRVWPR